MIRVIIVDDHELYRLGVRGAIESHHPDIVIAGEASNGEELFELLQHTGADLVLLDIILPGMPGTGIAYRLKEEYPGLKVLAVSAENSTPVIQTMLDIGIEGFISKRAGGTDVLSEAIRAVMSGLDYYGRDIAEIISRIYVAKTKSQKVSDRFTQQEKRIIELSHEGLSGKQIAYLLHISPRTVDNHKNNIFRKLGINSTLEMVQYALRKGIIQIDGSAGAVEYYR